MVRKRTEQDPHRRKTQFEAPSSTPVEIPPPRFPAVLLFIHGTQAPDVFRVRCVEAVQNLEDDSLVRFPRRSSK